MKKILFIILFFIPIPIFALTVDCPTIASIGETITCNIKENDINGLKLNYEPNNIFQSKNLIAENNWNIYHESQYGFAIGTPTNNMLDLKWNLTIQKNAEIDNSYELKLINIEKSTSQYQIQTIDNISKKIQIVSNIDTLDQIEVENGKWEKNFNKNTTIYQITVDHPTTSIKAIPTDNKAKVEGQQSEVKLNYGVNHFIIKVTSQRGTIKEYHLYITRPLKIKNKSSNAFLKKLQITNTQLEFQKEKYFYQLSVENNISKVEVIAEPEDSKAHITMEKEETLKIGDNTIKIIVTAEDGTQIIYHIQITRKEKMSNDATIKELLIKKYNLNFKSNKYNYKLKIQQENQLDIKIVLNDEKANYKIKGNKNLKNNSLIEIIVTAEDNTQKIYSIKIIKEEIKTNISISDTIKIIPSIIFIILILIILYLKKRTKI